VCLPLVVIPTEKPAAADVVAAAALGVWREERGTEESVSVWSNTEDTYTMHVEVYQQGINRQGLLDLLNRFNQQAGCRQAGCRQAGSLVSKFSNCPPKFSKNTTTCHSAFVSMVTECNVYVRSGDKGDIGWAVWIVLKCSKASQSFLNTHERLLTSAHPAKQTQGHWSRECQWGSNTTCAETTTPIFLCKQRTDLPYNDSLLGNTQGNAYAGISASFPFTPTSQHDHSLQTAVELCTCIVW